jgi:hypothetical protein
MVPDGIHFTFEVVVIAASEERAVEVLERRLAPANVLGDPNDPHTMGFPYIIGWNREPRRG